MWDEIEVFAVNNAKNTTRNSFADILEKSYVKVSYYLISIITAASVALPKLRKGKDLSKKLDAVLLFILYTAGLTLSLPFCISVAGYIDSSEQKDLIGLVVCLTALSTIHQFIGIPISKLIAEKVTGEPKDGFSKITYTLLKNKFSCTNQDEIDEEIPVTNNNLEMKKNYIENILTKKIDEEKKAKETLVKSFIQTLKENPDLADKLNSVITPSEEDQEEENETSLVSLLTNSLKLSKDITGFMSSLK